MTTHQGQSRALNALPLRKDKDTIFILGTGAVGKLVAHALRFNRKQQPPVTLLFHRSSLLVKWLGSNQELTVERFGDVEKSSGYEVELALPRRQAVEKNNSEELREEVNDEYKRFIKDDLIKHLIVTVKAGSTVSALNSIKHRLNRDSCILFLQNGMGIVEQINELVFPDSATRPTYLMGINSHGMTETRVFDTKHAGLGTMFLSILPREDGESVHGAETEKARALLQEIISIPVLAAVPVDHIELQQNQLEKLAVNCVLNPLTVMFDCHNGGLLHNNAASRVFRLLLAEICVVIQNMPELQSNPNLMARFNPARLETFVRSVAQRTSANISSMLQDVRRGRMTEIKYLNGYIVKRGEDLGIKCLMNYMLMQMVEGKCQMISREVDKHTPMEPATRKGRL